MRESPRDCPACGEGAVVPWRHATSADPRSAAATYALGRCHACGTGVVLDDVSELAALYEGGAYAAAPPRVDRLLEPFRRVADRTQLAALDGVGPGARVLEIGAGDGRLLALLAGRGLDVRGVDPFGPGESPVERIAAEALEVDEGVLDAAVFWHVLEHLDDPAPVVRAVVRGLAPRGRLVAAVPALDSLQAHLGGDRWFHQDVPRHRLLFTRAGLVRLLQRTGLRVTAVRNVVLDQNLLGMAQTLLNLLTRRRNVGFRALKRDLDGVAPRELAVTAVAAPAAVAAAVLLEASAMAVGRGGSVVVQATPAGAAR